MRVHQPRSFVFASLMLLLAGVLPAQVREMCTGTVRAQDGAPVAGAEVVFAESRWDFVVPDGERVAVAADDAGRFAAQLIVGRVYVAMAKAAADGGKIAVSPPRLWAAAGCELDLVCGAARAPYGIAVEGIERWLVDGPLSLRLLGPAAVPLTVDLPLPGDGAIEVPPCGVARAMAVLLDGRGCAIDVRELEFAERGRRLRFTPPVEVEVVVADIMGLPFERSEVLQLPPRFMAHAGTQTRQTNLPPRVAAVLDERGRGTVRVLGGEHAGALLVRATGCDLALPVRVVKDAAGLLRSVVFTPRVGQLREGQLRVGQLREGQLREGQLREGQLREGQSGVVQVAGLQPGEDLRITSWFDTGGTDGGAEFPFAAIAARAVGGGRLAIEPVSKKAFRSAPTYNRGAWIGLVPGAAVPRIAVTSGPALDLTKGVTHNVRVVDATGAPLVGALVDVGHMRFIGGAGVGQRSGVHAQVCTNGAGRVDIHEDEAGQLVVYARTEDAHGELRLLGKKAGGPVLLVLEPWCHATIEVVDRQGVAVRDARIVDVAVRSSVEKRRKDESGKVLDVAVECWAANWFDHQRSDAQGLLRVAHPGRDGLDIRVRVQGDDQRSEVVTLPVGGEPLRVVLD